MQYVRWLNEIRESDKNWAGEKAAGLGELIRAGLEVPRGFCVSAQAYVDTLAASKVTGRIASRLDSIDVGDPTQLEPAAEEIRSWICEMPIDSDVEHQVQTALDDLGSKFFAVRASRALTDVPDPASSGSQQAHLGVPRRQVINVIRQCWTTPWNSRAIYFRHRKKIAHEQVGMGVLIQTMIDADAAGVLFTASPFGNRLAEMHIDGIWGLGEAVNAARWKPDHYVVDKASGAIRENSIATKTVMQIVAAESGLQTIGVPEEKQTIPCLTDSQITALVEIGKKAEAHLQSAQDIGWCIMGDKIFVLQVRTIVKK